MLTWQSFASKRSHSPSTCPQRECKSQQIGGVHKIIKPKIEAALNSRSNRKTGLLLCKSVHKSKLQFFCANLIYLSNPLFVWQFGRHAQNATCLAWPTFRRCFNLQIQKFWQTTQFSVICFNSVKRKQIRILIEHQLPLFSICGRYPVSFCESAIPYLMHLIAIAIRRLLLQILQLQPRVSRSTTIYIFSCLVCFFHLFLWSEFSHLFFIPQQKWCAIAKAFTFTVDDFFLAFHLFSLLMWDRCFFFLRCSFAMLDLIEFLRSYFV